MQRKASGCGRLFLNALFKYRAWPWFVGGLLAGLIAYHGSVRLGGLEVVSRQDLDTQQRQLAALRQENRRLTEDVSRARALWEAEPRGVTLPYDEVADAAALVAAARSEALKARKFLMVTFGANWCLDCRTLHRNLKSEEVKKYTEGLFHFVNVDVGKFNRNREIAEELGVDLSRGIPVAIFFDPAGRVIGTTNQGQLEPARRYSSKQILRFVRDVAERSRIVAPDSVE